MKRSSGSTSIRTSPSLSHAERTAGDRGGGNPHGRSATGKPEPPPGAFRHDVHGPPGSGRQRRRPWQTRGDPPGTGMLQEHGPPGYPPWRGNARGDPPMVSAGSAQVTYTYGLSSGPVFHSRESIRGRPPPLTEATGPPGAMTLKPLSYWPPPGCDVVRRIATMARQARGDPPGTAALRRVADPPRSRVGPAPPGRAGPERIGRAPLGLDLCNWRGSALVTLKSRINPDPKTYGQQSDPKVSSNNTRLNGNFSTSQRGSPPGWSERQAVYLNEDCEIGIFSRNHP